MTVLIVDDSQTFRDRLKRHLQDAPGVSVAGEAVDGRAAIDEVERLRPDVVILDIHMPIADGFHVLRTLKERSTPPAVIVLTSDNSTAVRQRCAALGAVAVIDKSDAATDIIPALQQVKIRQV